MSLDKQVHLYSLETDHFYDADELVIHRRLTRAYRYRKYLKKTDTGAITRGSAMLEERMAFVNRYISKTKDKLRAAFQAHKGIRHLNPLAMQQRNIVSIFDSALTRTLNLAPDAVSTDLFIVQTYFFDVLKDLILDGFLFDGEKYVIFTASAGQIRTKKTLFIREGLLQKHQNALTCGLTVDAINAKGGANVNKYLAYLALCNSATDPWTDFDISRAIVVDDMETTIRSMVDFIDEKTYRITRREMDIAINHTDGCGMILPRKRKRSAMIRLPWIKGLLVPFPFDKFVREASKSDPSRPYGVVTDIYGNKHDLIKDKIEVILTKSQFKMWKYYSSWEEYQRNFVAYQCQAGICNEEEERFPNAKISYQMLQTLPDLSDQELLEISQTTRTNIINIGTDKRTMLKILGVTPYNVSKNHYQQALEIYPELLSDTYSREILKQVKKSMVRDARAGKLDVQGKYTFIVPDLYAFCEYLILGRSSPAGLLANGEVYCSLFPAGEKLDCLRSPHLYREHAVRKNAVDKEKSRWLVTKGLYTSIHDPISKILMFDNDGDKSLVCPDPTLVNAAERNMQGIVPLYYNMAKADAVQIHPRSLYEGLIAAYTGSNIGTISNDISKIWNSPSINMDVIKWLCMENNFAIDYAKTLYKVTRPADKQITISDYTRLKTPHFFIYAKNKDESQVEAGNASPVNRLARLIPNPRLRFSAANLGKFDYRALMRNPVIDLDLGINREIVERYTELDLKKRFLEIAQHDHEMTGDNQYVYQDIRRQLLSVHPDEQHVTDVLIEHLYRHKNSSFKTTLWSSFGDIIVDNIRSNVKNGSDEGYLICDGCGERVQRIARNQKMCQLCAKVADRLKARERMRRKRMFDSCAN